MITALGAKKCIEMERNCKQKFLGMNCSGLLITVLLSQIKDCFNRAIDNVWNISAEINVGVTHILCTSCDDVTRICIE